MWSTLILRSQAPSKLFLCGGCASSVLVHTHITANAITLLVIFTICFSDFSLSCVQYLDGEVRISPIAGAVTRYEKVGCILKHLTELHGDRTLRVARRVKNVCDSIAKKCWYYDYATRRCEDAARLECSRTVL